MHRDGGTIPGRVLRAETIMFPHAHRALAVPAAAGVSGRDAVAALGLDPPPALIVLNGGTELSPQLTPALRRLLADGLARLAIDEQVTALTGGTDAGVFALFGQGLGDERSAPCIGVAPAALVTWPGRNDGAALRGRDPDAALVPLEPHHSHFLLVEGDEWGVETEAMMALADALAARCPSIAVLAGGGAGAKREVLRHIDLGREVVVLAGTGRYADDLAAAQTGSGPADAEAKEAAASGLLTVFDAEAPPAALRELVARRLKLSSAEPRR